MAVLCDHTHTGSPGLEHEGLEAALADADARCVAAGERLTAPRRRVLELLLKAGQPVKAYDLMAGFGGAGEQAKPPTVYRALDFLGRIGLAHRIETLNAYMACRVGEVPHAAGFLICDCCGATREIHPPAPPEVRQAADDLGYVLTGITVEAHGKCAECRAG